MMKNKMFPYEHFQEELGDTLIGVYRYDILNGVTWILVVKTIDIRKLSALKIKWQKWSFIIFTKDDLTEGIDVFPLQYLYIKHHQETLFGPKVWDNLKLSKVEIRVRLEYEIRNKLIALREEFLKTGHGQDFLALVIPNFVIFLEALFYLKDLKPSRDFEIDLKTIEKEYQSDLSVFQKLWQWHQENEKIHRSEINGMIQTVHDQLNNLLKIINTLSL